MNISLHTRLILVKALILISLICSFASLYTEHKGWGDIYPFFTWKLYSQPLGTQRFVTNYRIYYKDKQDKFYTRLPVTPTKSFTTDEYVYTFNYLTKKTLEDTLQSTSYKDKLHTFVKYISPKKENYKIVEEIYNPKVLLYNINKYDTSTVITF